MDLRKDHCSFTTQSIGVGVDGSESRRVSYEYYSESQTRLKFHRLWSMEYAIGS